MPRLDKPGILDRFDARLAQLTPETQRRWGTMTANEMLCHLADSFRGMIGERVISPAPLFAAQRQLMRLVALHTPLPWPAGVPTRPEVNPRDKGTRPIMFESDRRAVHELMHRFARTDAQYATHPIFGPLTRREWMLWGYRHMDHHFRQFGL